MPKRVSRKKEQMDSWKLLVLVSLFLSLINSYYLFTMSSSTTDFKVALNTTSTLPTGNFVIAYSPLAVSLVFSLVVAVILIYRGIQQLR